MTFPSRSSIPAPTMELLAPAGTLQAFEAALEAGADAVYVGAPGLNARALARDFTLSEIAAMVAYAHANKKRLYVAINSLIKEDELPLAVETLAVLATIGPDALIVQDLALLYLVRRYFSRLKVHASTLMTVNHAVAANYFAGLGFERVVLARELSLEEIRVLHQHSTAELEIFIHGAMCFSYSGLCRFSSLHGGKSSLRGQCVQPCRRRYEWLPSGKSKSSRHGCGSGGYFFSMNDLAGIDHLAEARAAGVISLKIEGRLRSVEYVRNTVRAYRLALDALDVEPSQQAKVLEEAQRLLDAAMGRKRSTGFFIAGREERLIVPHLSGSTGTVIGKVVRLDPVRGRGKVGGATLEVMLQERVQLGDRLRLYEERTGERKNFTLKSMAVRGQAVSQAIKGQMAIVSMDGVDCGNLRQPFRGLLFRVDIGDRSEKVGPALTRQVKSLPGLPSCASSVQSILQELAIGRAKDTASTVQATRRRFVEPQGQSRQSKGEIEWWLKVRTLESLSLRFPFKVAKVVLELSRENLEQASKGRRVGTSGFAQLVWALPPVLHEAQLPWFRDAIRQIQCRGDAHFQVGHIGQLGLFAKYEQAMNEQQMHLYGDYSCNVLNSAALRMLASTGLSGVQFFLETDRSTLVTALEHYRYNCPQHKGRRMQVGLYVHGRPPLFTSRLDAPHFKGQRSFASPRGERFYLDSKEDTLYAYAHVSFSLLPYANELRGLGVNYFVVDISQGQPKKICAEMTALLSGWGELPSVISGNYVGTLM